MATSWKGTLSFGLINISVSATVAGRANKKHFRHLHTCGSPINQEYTCRQCKVKTSLHECTPAHEIGKDHFVPVTKDELSKCIPKSDKVMLIEKYVAAHEIDPMLYEASYYLQANPAEKRGYKLLYTALEEKKLFAIATVTMNKREHVVIIRPYRGGLAFHSMFYKDEIRDLPSIDLADVPVNPAELELAKQLLEAHQAPFEHAQYSDGYLQAVESLLAKKQAEMPALHVTSKQPHRPTVDLLDALRRSIPEPQPAPAPSLTLVPTRKNRQRKQAIAAEVKAS